MNTIDKNQFPKKPSNVKNFSFSEVRMKDINQYIIPIIKKQRGYLILYLETNNPTTNTICSF